MSLLKKVSVQNGTLVVRDEKGDVVNKASPRRGATKIEGWRAQLRKLNNGGVDQLVKLMNIANGVPSRSVLPDGRYTEWEVPSVSEQRQATQFLLEFQLGKAGSQLEIIKAEESSQELAQLNALSDEQVAELARPFLERAYKKDDEGVE